MAGEKNLQILLRSMAPSVRADNFVFCSFEKTSYGAHAELQPIASFAEDEGLTLVIPRANADQHQLEYESEFKCITLNVHSSLDAVGLTAAFSNKLAEHNISANVIAGCFHDHIFVQTEFADQALTALMELTR